MEKRDNEQEQRRREKSDDETPTPDLTSLPPEEWSPWPLLRPFKDVGRYFGYPKGQRISKEEWPNNPLP